MDPNTKMGSNKTGIDMSPILSKQMIEGSKKLQLDGEDGYTNLTLLEQFYLDNDDPLGSVPMPGSVKGVVKSAAKMLTGHHPEVFLNKLGERLAFERSGVRIYEQLILKCEHMAANAMDGLTLSPPTNAAPSSSFPNFRIRSSDGANTGCGRVRCSGIRIDESDHGPTHIDQSKPGSHVID